MPRTSVWAFYEGNDLQDIDAYESYQRDLHWILNGAPGVAVRAGIREERPGVYDPDVVAARAATAARLFTGQFVDHEGKPLPMYFPTGVQHGDGGPELPRAAAPQFEKAKAILAKAHALCRQQGIELVVVFIPCKFRVYRSLCTFDPDSPCLSWPIDDLPGALRSAVAEVSDGIQFVDLTPRLQAERPPGIALPARRTALDGRRTSHRRPGPGRIIPEAACSGRGRDCGEMSKRKPTDSRLRLFPPRIIALIPGFPVVVEDAGVTHRPLVRAEGEGPVNGDAGPGGIARDRARIEFDMELTLSGQHAAELGEYRDSGKEWASRGKKSQCDALKMSGPVDLLLHVTLLRNRK